MEPFEVKFSHNWDPCRPCIMRETSEIPAPTPDTEPKKLPRAGNLHGGWPRVGGGSPGTTGIARNYT